MSIGAFGIPDQDDLRSAFAVTAEQRNEAWSISIAQANTLEQLDGYEERLHRRIELLRQREVSPAVERRALSLCARRRQEILGAIPAPGIGRDATVKRI